MIVLVPAYQPGARLVRLVDDLRSAAADVEVVVVDDGSGPASAPALDAVRARGATVLAHPVNRGKGRALKTGFAHVLRHRPGQVVVCADCDGQHSVLDVLRVGRRVAETGATVLGVRRFGPGVPLRSRVGNLVSRAAFTVATRRHVRDTQTGLRGYPSAALPGLLAVEGERYEYESALLVDAARRGTPLEQVEVATIYLDHNASSHFRPVLDSLRVLGPVAAFGAVALASFALDTAVLLAVHALTGALLPSVLVARAVSSTANFWANRHLVFRAVDVPWQVAARRYWTLAAGLLVAGYLLLAALTSVGLPLPVAKVGSDVTLLVTSYLLQRYRVFRAPAGRREVHSRRTAGGEPAHTSAVESSSTTPTTTGT